MCPTYRSAEGPRDDGECFSANSLTSSQEKTPSIWTAIFRSNKDVHRHPQQREARCSHSPQKSESQAQAMARPTKKRRKQTNYVPCVPPLTVGENVKCQLESTGTRWISLTARHLTQRNDTKSRALDGEYLNAMGAYLEDRTIVCLARSLTVIRENQLVVN